MKVEGRWATRPPAQEHLEPRSQEKQEEASLEPDPRTLAVSVEICHEPQGLLQTFLHQPCLPSAARCTLWPSWGRLSDATTCLCHPQKA